jgi:hypothetical protein
MQAKDRPRSDKVTPVRATTTLREKHTLQQALTRWAQTPESVASLVRQVETLEASGWHFPTSTSTVYGATSTFCLGLGRTSKERTEDGWETWMTCISFLGLRRPRLLCAGQPISKFTRPGDASRAVERKQNVGARHAVFADTPGSS